MFGWYFYYFAFIGVTALRYDRRSGQMRRCKYLLVYTAAQNVLMLLLSPPALLYELQLAQQVYATNGKFDFADIVALVIEMLLQLVVPLTLVLRWRCEPQLLRLLRELHALPRADGVAVPRGNCSFKWLTGMVFYHNFIMARDIVVLVQGRGWRGVGVAYHFYVRLNMLHVVVMLYVLLLSHICQRMQQLRAQLERISARAAGAETLHALGGTYVRLVQLAQRLTGIYQEQLLYAMTNLCISNASFGYFFVRFRSSVLLPDNVFNWLLSLVLYVLLFLYFYCFNNICEQARNSAPAMRQTLRNFNDLPQLTPELQQACEALALQLQHVGVRVRMLGLFELRRSVTFHSVALILLYSVWLVQWDFENI